MKKRVFTLLLALCLIVSLLPFGAAAADIPDTDYDPDVPEDHRVTMCVGDSITISFPTNQEATFYIISGNESGGLEFAQSGRSSVVMPGYASYVYSYKLTANEAGNYVISIGSSASTGTAMYQIIAQPHDWGDWALSMAPTCTAQGEETRVCSRNNQHTDTRAVAALGHDYQNAGVTPATCTEEGYTTYTCTRCGRSYTEAQESALGHDWGDWKVTKAATATEKGVETRVCKNDPKHKETREYSLKVYNSDLGITLTTSEQLPSNVKFIAEEYEGPRDLYEMMYDQDVFHFYRVCLYTEDNGEQYYYFPKEAVTITFPVPADIDPDSIIMNSSKTTASVIHEKDQIDYQLSKDKKTLTITTKEPREFDMIGNAPKPSDQKPADTKPALKNPFTDVKDGDYFFDPVLWALNHDPQITDGMTETTFAPGETCTRGQVVTFLWRSMGCEEPKSTNNPFSDVTASDYFYKAVLWAVEKGITDGTSDTTFSPNDPCTRAHVVTFLWRAENKPAAGSDNPFADVASGQYYYDAVLWAVSKQITDGTSDTTFSPNDPCTRGQIVTFLYRDMK